MVDFDRGTYRYKYVNYELQTANPDPKLNAASPEDSHIVEVFTILAQLIGSSATGVGDSVGGGHGGAGLDGYTEGG